MWKYSYKEAQNVFNKHQLADLAGEFRGLSTEISNILAQNPPPDVKQYLENLSKNIIAASSKLKDMGSWKGDASKYPQATRQNVPSTTDTFKPKNIVGGDL